MLLRTLLPTSLLLLHAACGGSAASADGSGSDGSSSSSPGSASDEAPARYGVESLLVEYRLEGTPSGTETLTFDRFGARERSVAEHVIELGAMRQTTSTTTLTEGAWITTLDADARRATRTQNPLYDQLVRAADGDVQEVGRRMLEAMGAERTGSEEVAGLPCEVWEIPIGNSKSWIWNGVTLRTESRMGPLTTSKVAVRVEQNPDFDAEHFAVPADWEVVELDLGRVLGGR